MMAAWSKYLTVDGFIEPAILKLLRAPRSQQGSKYPLLFYGFLIGRTITCVISRARWNYQRVVATKSSTKLDTVGKLLFYKDPTNLSTKLEFGIIEHR